MVGCRIVSIHQHSIWLVLLLISLSSQQQLLDQLPNLEPQFQHNQDHPEHNQNPVPLLDPLSMLKTLIYPSAQSPGAGRQKRMDGSSIQTAIIPTVEVESYTFDLPITLTPLQAPGSKYYAMNTLELPETFKHTDLFKNTNSYIYTCPVYAHCSQIVTSNLFSSTSCSLPIYCHNVMYSKLTSTWYGSGTALCQGTPFPYTVIGKTASINSTCWSRILDWNSDVSKIFPAYRSFFAVQHLDKSYSIYPYPHMTASFTISTATTSPKLQFPTMYPANEQGNYCYLSPKFFSSSTNNLNQLTSIFKYTHFHNPSIEVSGISSQPTEDDFEFDMFWSYKYSTKIVSSTKERIGAYYTCTPVTTIYVTVINTLASYTTHLVLVILTHLWSILVEFATGVTTSIMLHAPTMNPIYTLYLLTLCWLVYRRVSLLSSFVLLLILSTILFPYLH